MSKSNSVLGWYCSYNMFLLLLQRNHLSLITTQSHELQYNIKNALLQRLMPHSCLTKEGSLETRWVETKNTYPYRWEDGPNQ